jgi:Ankyrin repeats (3 copies)/Ankyrin repeat
MLSKEEYKIYEIFKKYCQNGDLVNAKEFLQDNIDMKIPSHIIEVCCLYDQLDIAKWVITLEKNICLNECNWDDTFRECCIRNKSDAAIWLLSLQLQFRDVNGAFFWACRYNQINVVKELLKKFKNIDIHQKDDHDFIDCCKYRRLDLARFLWDIDNTFNIQSTFIECCMDGKLEGIQWLLSLGKPIDINDIGFVYSCMFNHLNVAQFLWKLNPNINIHENDYSAFRECCESNYVEIAHWLCSICEDYKFTIENKKITKYEISAHGNKIVVDCNEIKNKYDDYLCEGMR